jgi:hypothetical protein
MSWAFTAPADALAYYERRRFAEELREGYLALRDDKEYQAEMTLFDGVSADGLPGIGSRGDP